MAVRASKGKAAQLNSGDDVHGLRWCFSLGSSGYGGGEALGYSSGVQFPSTAAATVGCRCGLELGAAAGEK
jgi:hypothetical protein